MAYVTRDDIRELDNMDDDDAFTDEAIDAAIIDAEYRIDRECGTSFEPKAFDVTVVGMGSSTVDLKTREGRRVMFPRNDATTDEANHLYALTITVDGEAFTDTVTVDNIGCLTRASGFFAAGAVINVTGRAGVTNTPPPDIGLAAKLLAKQTVRDGITGLSNRTIRRTNEYGSEVIAQPGTKYPTGIPLVDAILQRNNHLPPAVV